MKNKVEIISRKMNLLVLTVMTLCSVLYISSAIYLQDGTIDYADIWASNFKTEDNIVRYIDGFNIKTLISQEK